MQKTQYQCKMVWKIDWWCFWNCSCNSFLDIQPVLKKTHFSWKKSIYAGCNFIYVWKLILTFGMVSLGSNDSLHLLGHALIPRQEDSGVICLQTFLQTFSMSSLFVGCSFVSSLMPSPLINFYFVGNLWKENFTIFHMSSIRNL